MTVKPKPCPLCGGEPRAWCRECRRNAGGMEGDAAVEARSARADDARMAELESLVRDMHAKMDRMARLADGWMDTVSFTGEWEEFGERMAGLGIEEERW